MRKTLAKLALAVMVGLAGTNLQVQSDSTRTSTNDSCYSTKQILAANRGDTTYNCRNPWIAFEKDMLAARLLESESNLLKSWYGLDSYDLEQAQKSGDSTKVQEISSRMDKRNADFRKKYGAVLKK